MLGLKRVSTVAVVVSTLLLGGCFSEEEAEPYEKVDIKSACESLVKDELRSQGANPGLVFVDDEKLPAQATEFDERVSGTFYGSSSGHKEMEFRGRCSLVPEREENRVVGVTFGPLSSKEPISNTPEPTPDAEVPIPRVKIDPENDRSGQTGRDDNLGIAYHNSVDWKWLEAPGKVVPGGRMHNLTQKAMCSVGFIASHGNRGFIVTAGHCGNVGDEIAIRDSNGKMLRVGEFVESFVEGNSDGGIDGADIGLIELYPNVPVDSALPVDLPMKGWVTPQQAKAHEMMICRLGATTGYACGKFEDVGKSGLFYFRTIADRGDSGGAVFAVDRTGVWAVGVTSNVSDYNKTYLGAMEIDSAMKHWGLTLHN